MHRSRKSVFVSSTSQDLRSYREVVKQALLTGGVFPFVQEHFPPDYRELTEFLVDHIRDCDAIICLVGFAFGASPEQPANEVRRSYTQIEYDIASKLAKRIYVFIATEDCPVDEQRPDSEQEALLQTAHRETLQRRHKWTPFSSAEELRLRIAETIPTLYERGASAPLPFRYLHPPQPPAFFSGRQEELQELTEALKRPYPSVVAVAGIGGQGKTTLVSHWLKEHEPAGFATGFWCTAYRGGFTFDMFLDASLNYLMEGAFVKPGLEDPAARTQKLIELLQERPSVIVIDGIERWLQGWNQAHADLHAADTVGERGGHFEGLDDFLSAASGITNGSHLVITTRALPAVLDDAAIAMIPVIELGKRYPLAGLGDDDAVALLRSMGVTGEVTELRNAARSYANHPLALTVLGSLLTKGYGGRLKPLGDDAVMDPRLRLFQLLEETRINLPGREQAERFLQIASHCLENPSLETLGALLAKLHSESQGALSGLLGRFFQFPKKDANPELLEMAVTLADWQLLNWDGLNGIVRIHPVIKSFFVERTKDSKTIHRHLSEWYSEQLIQIEPVSMDHARPRLLAIEHALRAGEIERGADLMFAPFTVGLTFYDWLSTWGHLSVGAALLEQLALAAEGELRGQLLLARAALHHQLGCPQKSLNELDEAIEIFGAAGSLQSKTNLARALASRGNIHRETGTSSRAIPDFDRGLEIFQRSSQSVEGQTDLGKTLVNRGNALLDLGHWSRALADYDQAVAIFRKLAEAKPQAGESLLASALTSRGIVLAEMDQADRSIIDFREAIALYVKYGESADQRVAVRLAHVRTMLGTKLNEQGRSEESLKSFDDAVEALEPMVNEGRQDAAPPLALALMDRAKAGITLSRFESAVDDATRGIAMYERLVSEGGPHFEGSLGHSYLMRAEALHSQGDFAGSAGDRTTGLTIIRKLMREWADESDIRIVFLQRGMSAVEYLLPVNPQEAAAILGQVMDEIGKTFGQPPVSEAVMNEARRVSDSLKRLWPDLVSAGVDVSRVSELARLVRGEDDLPHISEP